MTVRTADRLRDAVLAVGRQALGWRLVYGLAGVAVALLSAGFVVGVADYLLRSEELGVRLLGTLAVTAAVAVAVWHFLWPVLRSGVSPLEVAQRIEQRFPELHDRLASSLEFLDQSEEDLTAGSPTLRRAVVAETETLVERLPLTDAIDRRVPLRWAAGAGVALLVVGFAFVCDYSNSLLAARRIVMPFSAAPWPRRNNLEFQNAPRVHPAERDLELVLVDRGGALPNLVDVQYRFDGDAAIRHRRFEGQLGDRLTFSLSKVSQSLEYRAVGGDHASMAWQRMELIRFPEVTRLDCRLTPPAYTRLVGSTSNGRIRALAGTTATLAGDFSSPVERATLVMEEEGRKSSRPLALDATRTKFTWPAGAAPWKLTASGHYAIEVVDPRLTAPGDPAYISTRYEMQITPDRTPTVSLEQPGDNAVVTTSAKVRIVVAVRDDLAIHRVLLHWQRSDAMGAAPPLELYAGPELPPNPPANLGDAPPPGESRTLTYEWDLSRHADLTPGVTLEMRAVATDYRPGEGSSPLRRLTVITPDELEDRLALRQSQLLGQLAEVLKIERQSRLHVAALEVQLSEVGSLVRDDVNRLQSAELAQRDVDRLLGRAENGAIAQLNDMLAEIDHNRLDRPELSRRLTALRDELQELADEPLPAIARSLIAALKGVQAVLSDGTPVEPSPPRNERFAREVAAPLAVAGGGQDKIIAALERLLGDLTQWDNYRRFARDIAQVRGEQRDLVQRTRDLRQATLAKPASELTPRELADFKAAALAERELTRRLERIGSQMEVARGELRDKDPLAAEALADALDALRREDVAGQMRAGADQVERSQAAQAVESLEGALAGLQETLDALSGKREHELERLVQKLREAAAELETLKAEQEGLRKKADAARQQSDPARQREELQRLTNQEQALREKIDRLARRLERLQAQEASQALRQAGEAAGAAAAAGEKGAADQHEEQLEQAGQDLAQAEQKLKQALKKAESDLLDQQLSKLEQAIGAIITQQESVVAEVDRLTAVQMASSEFGRTELIAIRDLARAERGIMAEARQFAEKIAAARIFHVGLIGAGREMERTAEALDARELGPAAKQPAELALAKLNLLREALQNRKGGGDQQPPMPMEDGGMGGDPPPNQDGISSLAELKLLKFLQESVLQRTQQLAEAVGSKPLTETQERELAALAAEQGALADLVVNLSQPKTPAPEDDPDKLPDPRGPLPPDKQPPGENLDRDLENSLDGDLPGLENQP